MKIALSQMKVTSSSFAADGQIPTRYTQLGEDVSPQLAWSDVPEGTVSFAVVCHDPDAPILHEGSYGVPHWVLYNIPGDVREIAEGDDRSFTAGLTYLGKPGYIGPKPPPGHGVHHYYFMVFALDEDLKLTKHIEMPTLLKSIEPSTLGMSRLIGTYEQPG